MALDLKENHKNTKESMQNERRRFLKKAVYSTPVFMILGYLIRPTRVKAFDPLPSSPDWPPNV